MSVPLFVLVLFIATAQSVRSEPPREIRIVAPYAGWLTNAYERSSDMGDIELTDTGLMLGLYAQWIRPGSFQGNVFLYHAPEVNYATLWGIHSNVDFYFDIGRLRNLVAGGGLELLTLDIDAGDNVDGLQGFELQTAIIAPFLRAGTQFPLSNDWAQLVIFPWAGAELDIVRGDLEFLAPFGPPSGTPVETSLDDESLYALAGINVRSTLFRFIQLDAKYSAAFTPHAYLPRTSLMANVFFTRNLGVSYRFSYMENSAGSNLYHLLGTVVMF